MTNYPKLRYPINTTGLEKEQRMILLAYDIIWRTKEGSKVMTWPKESVYIQDLDANLANLGHYIEHQICGMDMALRFEGYDNVSPENQETFEEPLEHDHQTSSEMEEEFQKITLAELKN